MFWKLKDGCGTDCSGMLYTRKPWSKCGNDLGGATTKPCGHIPWITCVIKSTLNGGWAITLSRSCSSMRALNSTTSFRTEGSSTAGFCKQTCCSSSLNIFSLAFCTMRTLGFTLTMPVNAVGEGGCDHGGVTPPYVL